VRFLTGSKQRRRRRNTGAGRRRLADGAGVAVEQQGTSMHPWDSSAQPEVAHGLLAVEAGGSSSGGL